MRLWYGIFAAVVLGCWVIRARATELIDAELLHLLEQDGWLRDWVN